MGLPCNGDSTELNKTAKSSLNHHNRREPMKICAISWFCAIPGKDCFSALWSLTTLGDQSRTKQSWENHSTTRIWRIRLSIYPTDSIYVSGFKKFPTTCQKNCACARECNFTPSPCQCRRSLAEAPPSVWAWFHIHAVSSWIRPKEETW